MTKYSWAKQKALSFFPTENKSRRRGLRYKGILIFTVSMRISALLIILALAGIARSCKSPIYAPPWNYATGKRKDPAIMCTDSATDCLPGETCEYRSHHSVRKMCKSCAVDVGGFARCQENNTCPDDQLCIPDLQLCAPRPPAFQSDAAPLTSSSGRVPFIQACAVAVLLAVMTTV